MTWPEMTFALMATLAAWDATRRIVDAKRFNQSALDQLSELRQQLKDQHQQVQAVAGKLNAATASTATRLVRAGQR